MVAKAEKTGKLVRLEDGFVTNSKGYVQTMDSPIDRQKVNTKASIQERMSTLPQVQKVLEHPLLSSQFEIHSRSFVVYIVRKLVDTLRTQLREGSNDSTTKEQSIKWIAEQFETAVRHEQTGKLKRVINATGVIIHTNLGRSPLPERALKRMFEVSSGYTNLEIDFTTRKRGGRMEGIARLMQTLTGAEATYVVNNNAAAVLLALSTMAPGKEVIISRGELVEIGGSFRIPDVMRAAGVILREVGTTNRTHLRDYEEAIHENTGLILKVHPSNYAISGFTSEVELDALVQLGKKYAIPVMNDLGSGSILDFSDVGVHFSSPLGAKTHEPTLRAVLQTGVDLVTCSGDKLLGGPQSGLLLGSDFWVRSAASQPLTRALRVDKLTLSGLEATLQIYAENGLEATDLIPIWKQMTTSIEQLQERGQYIQLRSEQLRPLDVTLEHAQAAVGGGALPSAFLPTVRLVLQHPTVSVEVLERHLRMREEPILGLLDRKRLVLDLRTIHPDEMYKVEYALKELAALQ